MRVWLAAVMIFMALAAPMTAEAKGLEMATGAVIGGLAGSIYVSGLAATADVVVSATAVAANAVATAVPAIASGIAGAVAGASAPVLIGVIAGSAIGLLLAN
jgi:hypothetical protein